MKGVVFTEFLEYVEQEFGLEIADRIITESTLESKGVYTRVGTYDYQEILQLIGRLGDISGIEISALVEKFGYYLFFRLNALYPQYESRSTSAIDFLSKIDDTIHVEVRKLYPDAELPIISCKVASENEFEIHYSSSRPFADLAMGLLQGCLEHFNESYEIRRLDGESNHEAVFLLIRKDN